MKPRSLLLTAAATAILALPVPASAVAAPTAPVGRVITGVTLSTDTVNVSGFDTAPVTATVTVTGDGGVCSAAGSYGGVGLSRTSSQKWDRSATVFLGAGLSCISDSGGVRTYRAVIPVPSTADGAWRVTEVEFGNADYVDPRALGLPDPTLTVTGSHRPRLRLTLAPQPLPYPRRMVTLTVQASFDDTREPIADRFVSVMYDIVSACPGCSGTTDSNGRLVRAVPVAEGRSLLAAFPIPAGYDDWWANYSLLYARVGVQPALSAAAAKSSVRHGTNVDVKGRALAVGVLDWPSRPRVHVELQRLVGRHWRTVSTGTIRQKGRFTLVATPPKGRNLYRVAFPTQPTFASATSRTFVISGT